MLGKTFKVKFRVQWVDTDSAQIMHFSNYFRYFEYAETELFNQFNMDYAHFKKVFKIDFPRIEAHCRYLSPCRFNDIIEVEIDIIELGNKHIKYGFKIWNKTTESLSAEGYVVVVAADLKSKKAVEIPEPIKSKLREFFNLN